MKAFSNLALVAALALSAVAPSFSQAAGAAAPQTLKSVMGQMGDSMGVLVDALIKNKPVPDAKLLAAADALPGLAVAASKIMPSDSMTQADVAEYKDLMTKLVAALTELDQDVKSGNKAQAKATLIQKVSPIQKQGHTEFKKD